jgi:Sortase domain
VTKARRHAALLISAGIVLLAGFGVVACHAEPPPSVGSSTVAAMASSAPTPTEEPRTVVPDKLRIPALKLNAAVTAVGVDPAGDFDVPPSVDRVGWYKFGPGLEATTGSIVIAGHVDSAAQGKGAFFELGTLSIGDRIDLSGPGKDVRFRVVGRERYAKTRIPLDRYFARVGSLRLTLITCGGPFNARTGHYRDNVVVTASPV